MGKKERRFPKWILPEYDPAARFCYFYDLAEIDEKIKKENHSLAAHKTALANKVKSELNTDIFDVKPDNDNEVIKDAITFLKNAANNERAKEVSIATQYMQEIKNMFGENKSKDIEDIIAGLEMFCQDPSGGIKETRNFYTKLTTFINLVKTSKVELEERVKRILQTGRGNIKELSGDQLIYRTFSDIEGILKNAIGIKSREIENSFASRLQSLLLDFIVKDIEKNHLNIKIIDNPGAVIAAIMVAFSKYLQQWFDKNGAKSGLKKIDEINDEILTDILNSFFNEENNNKLLSTLREETNEGLDDLRKFSSQFGFGYLISEEEIEQRQKEIKNRRDSYTRRVRKATKKEEKLPLDPNRGRSILREHDKDLYDQWIKNLTWNVTTSGKDLRHGMLDEFEKALTQRGTYKIGGSAAADTLSFPLAEIEMSIGSTPTSFINSKVKEIVKRIENSVKTTSRENRNDDNGIEELKRMHEDIEEYLRLINGELAKYDRVRDLFIYHESIKLYARFEEHKMGKNEGFEGRSLGIFNYLDRIYTLQGSLALLDKDVMYSIAMNLSELALGHQMQPAIENYFSIFAGMLMFDDVQSFSGAVAKDMVYDFSGKNTAKQIHLYIINDIYYPASMILSFVADALSEGYAKISTQAISATINTKESDETIQDYLDKYFYGNDKKLYTKESNGDETYPLWQKEGNKIYSGTTVKIQFLAAFLNFIKELQQTIEQFNA